jgi:carbohydrate kinase (thermoresistant glucokinase family)
MGPAGSGKTTIGLLLARELHCKYAEADDFHPAVNLARMAAGQPLADDDRWPWLRAIRAFIDATIAEGESAVVTCSALKRSYRELLRRPGVKLVYLRGSREELQRRLAARQGHFFKATMLDGQLLDLEEPAPDEQVLVVSIGAEPSAIVASILAGVGSLP